MKTISQHISYAKSQPHHVRKRITFTAAFIGTAIVTIVWFIGSLSSGAFALKNNSIASDSEENSSAVTSSGVQGIAGAAASVEETQGAQIEIVDTSPSNDEGKQAEQTIIPF